MEKINLSLVKCAHFLYGSKGNEFLGGRSVKIGSKIPITCTATKKKCRIWHEENSKQSNVRWVKTIRGCNFFPTKLLLKEDVTVRVSELLQRGKYSESCGSAD